MKKLTKAQRHRYIRVAWDVKGKPRFCEFFETPPLNKRVDTALDEVIIGEWFRLERLSDETWWLRVGMREFELRARAGDPVEMVEFVTPAITGYGGTD